MIWGGENLAQFGAAAVQALFNSLWIGLLVVVAVASYIRFDRSLNAASRHAAWYAALVVVAALPVVSFAVSLTQTHVVTNDYVIVAPGPQVESTASNVVHADTAAPNTLREFVAPAFARMLTPDTLERVGIALVALLAIVALARLGALVVGLVGLARVKRASAIVDPSLSPTLAVAMARDLRPRAVTIRVSDAIDAPAAAGFRSPAILLPAQLVETLDRQSLDQIALHEYAHLRRYDDWTNLAQRCIERAFWFNPVVSYVGRNIDLEREIACDDWAVSGASGVSGYADCLWHLASDGRVPAFAATAPGAFATRSQIVARIEHLLQRRRDGAPTLRFSRLAPLAPVLACALALVAGRAPAIALHAPVQVTPVASVAAHAQSSQKVYVIAATTTRVTVPAVSLGVVAAGAPRSVVAPTLAVHAKVASNAKCSSKTAKATTLARGRGVGTGKATGTAIAMIAHPAISVSTTVTVRTTSGLRTMATARSMAPVQPMAAAMNEVAQAVQAQHSAMEAAAHANAAVELSQANDGLAEYHRAVHEQLHRAMRAQTKVWSVAKSQTMLVAATDETDDYSFGPNDRNLLAHCTGCDLSNKDLRNADLHGLALTGDDLSGADLRGANLRSAVLTGVDLSDAKLDGADLRGAVLTGANIDGATFSGAKTDGIRLIGMQLTEDILRSSSVRSIINACAGCDLSDLDLRGRDLHGITLDGADLHNTNFSGANLAGSRFNGVDLAGVDFTGADLRNVEFNGCDLSDVDLSRAKDTSGIHIHGSNLADGSNSW